MYRSCSCDTFRIYGIWNFVASRTTIKKAFLEKPGNCTELNLLSNAQA
jgi:hypothetical protein